MNTKPSRPAARLRQREANELLFVAIVLPHLHNSDGDYLVLHTVDKAVFLVYAARPIACIIAHEGFRLASTLVWMDAQYLKQTLDFHDAFLVSTAAKCTKLLFGLWSQFYAVHHRQSICLTSSRLTSRAIPCFS